MLTLCEGLLHSAEEQEILSSSAGCTRLVRHAKLVRVHAHAAHAGHRKVEGWHRMAQLPRKGQHKAAQAGIHVAPYARPARDLRQRHAALREWGSSAET